jgi:hypothetical protein
MGKINEDEDKIDIDMIRYARPWPEEKLREIIRDEIAKFEERLNRSMRDDGR